MIYWLILELPSLPPPPPRSRRPAWASICLLHGEKSEYRRGKKGSAGLRGGGGGLEPNTTRGPWVTVPTRKYDCNPSLRHPICFQHPGIILFRKDPVSSHRVPTPTPPSSTPGKAGRNQLNVGISPPPHPSPFTPSSSVCISLFYPHLTLRTGLCEDDSKKAGGEEAALHHVPEHRNELLCAQKHHSPLHKCTYYSFNKPKCNENLKRTGSRDGL